MTKEERELLLTIGRVLRARIKEHEISQNDRDDIADLSEALAPFEASKDHGGDYFGPMLAE